MSARRPRFIQLIGAILLALVVSLSVACSGSPPPDPTAAEATTQPPTATQPNQPTQPQTLSPTRRTPIQTLNPGQIQATRQAQLATIRAQIPPPTPQVIYPTAPRPFPTLIPPPTIPPFLLQTIEPPQMPTLTPWVLPTLEPLPTPKLLVLPVLPTLSPLPTLSLQPPTPHLRYMDEKGYMLRLINNERRAAGVPEVALGVNDAAQLHAENSLEGCYSSHWGSDGLKPYMRYSLAGGYQSNGENGSGLDYCIKARDGYAALSGIETEIRETMTVWMSSLGHRRNILEKNHRKVNIGLAWDRYNLIAVQHFEGDYVEFETLPEFDGDTLRFEGKVKNGASFGVGDTIPVQIFYDPPPHSLTPGQLSRTYCYDLGLPVAYVLKPLTGGLSYVQDTLDTTYNPCSSPYDVSPDASAPQSPSQALAHWQTAYDASKSTKKSVVEMQGVTASGWGTGSGEFRITASLGNVLKKHGPGVYTVVLWGVVGGEIEIISEYSIFHDIPRPDGYD